MDVNVKDQPENKKEIDVVLPPEKIEEYGEKAAEAISSENTIDGFRPGKAPKQVVEEKFGKDRVWQESCYQALKDTYSEIIKEKGFFVISPPEIKTEKIETGKPFSYKIIVTTFPEIDLPDYKKIAKEIVKEKKEVEIDEKETDEALKTIQRSRAKTKVVSREAQNDDELVIDFQGSIDGVKQEELKAEKMNFVLGEKKFIEGFEDQLIGMKEGDSKDFSLEMDMPSESKEKPSKKKVDFSVTVTSVKEREVPELNDEFAKSLGDFSGLNDLKDKIKENIKTEKDRKEKERIRIKTIEAVGEKSSVDIPETMVSKELDNMMSEFKERLSQSKMSLEDYLKKSGKTEQEIRKDWEEKARKRILTSLILQEIAKKENVEVSDEEVEKEANAYLSRFSGQKEQLPDTEKLKLYIKDVIQNEKVFKLLEE